MKSKPALDEDVMQDDLGSWNLGNFRVHSNVKEYEGVWRWEDLKKEGQVDRGIVGNENIHGGKMEKEIERWKAVCEAGLTLKKEIY